YAIEQLARTAEICVQRATEVSPHVHPIGRVFIPQKPFMGDPSTFRRVLKQASSQVAAVQNDVKKQLELVRNHVDTAKADLNTATTELSHAQDDLNAFRLSVFERLSCASPPKYSDLDMWA
ncbi:hypothetical protein R3P38DRAFT_3002357, partial [Favolaschia claudopus]